MGGRSRRLTADPHGVGCARQMMGWKVPADAASRAEADRTGEWRRVILHEIIHGLGFSIQKLKAVGGTTVATGDQMVRYPLFYSVLEPGGVVAAQWPARFRAVPFCEVPAHALPFRDRMHRLRPPRLRLCVCRSPAGRTGWRRCGRWLMLMGAATRCGT